MLFLSEAQAVSCWSWIFAYAYAENNNQGNGLRIEDPEMQVRWMPGLLVGSLWRRAIVTIREECECTN